MTTKFSIPPLVPSAEERSKNFMRSFEAAVHPAMRDVAIDCVSHLQIRACYDGFRAGIDAVTALLREPDEAMREAAWKAITPVEHQYSRMNIVEYRQTIAQVAARALADELERRKP